MMPRNNSFSRMFAISIAVTIIEAALVAQDSDLFRFKDRGSRYEGIVDRPNGNRDYEITGFFALKDVGVLPKTGKLHLMFYVPKDDKVASVVAQEIRNDTQYRMEPKVGKLKPLANGWCSFDDWPVSAVILPSKVEPANLGVVVRLQDASIPGLLAPAILSSGDERGPIEEYTLYFVSHKPLKTLTCKVVGTGKPEDCSLGSSRNPGRTSKPVPIKFNAARLPEGNLTIRLRGEYENDMSSEGLKADIHFFHAKLPS